VSAEAIAKRLSSAAHREGKGWRTQCPVHHGFNLIVADGKSGKLLVKCWGGDCSGTEILQELWRLELHGKGFMPPIQDPQDAVNDLAHRTAIAQRLWDKSAPLTARSLVTSYLRSRAITLPAPPSLRYSPLCPHPDKIRLPAMVAKIVNVDDELIGVHRIF
jgi:hypothetical protein